MRYGEIMNRIHKGVIMFRMKYLMEPDTITMSTETKNIIRSILNEQRDALVMLYGLPKTETLNQMEVNSIFGMQIIISERLEPYTFVIGGVTVECIGDPVTTAE